MGLLWEHDDVAARAYPDEATILSVFPSVAREGKWTWVSAGAHGHDSGYFDTPNDAKAAAEAWWAMNRRTGE